MKSHAPGVEKLSRDQSACNHDGAAMGHKPYPVIGRKIMAPDDFYIGNNRHDGE